MTFDEWAQTIAFTIAHEVDSIYGNPDKGDQEGDRRSLERILALVSEARDGLIDQSAPRDDAEIRRRVDFRDAIHGLADYINSKLVMFDEDPSVDELLALVQPLVFVWDDNYRDPAHKDRSESHPPSRMAPDITYIIGSGSGADRWLRSSAQ